MPVFTCLATIHQGDASNKNTDPRCIKEERKHVFPILCIPPAPWHPSCWQRGWSRMWLPLDTVLAAQGQAGSPNGGSCSGGLLWILESQMFCTYSYWSRCISSVGLSRHSVMGGRILPEPSAIHAGRLGTKEREGRAQLRWCCMQGPLAVLSREGSPQHLLNNN